MKNLAIALGIVAALSAAPARSQDIEYETPTRVEDTICGYLADSIGNRSGVVDAPEMGIADACMNSKEPLYVRVQFDQRTPTVYIPENVEVHDQAWKAQNEAQRIRTWARQGVVEILPGNEIGKIWRIAPNTTLEEMPDHELENEKYMGERAVRNYF